MEPRRRGTRHFRQGSVDDIRSPRKLCLAERRRLGSHAIELVLGHSPEHGCRIAGGRGDDDEIAQSFKQVFDESARILAGLDDAIH